MKNFAVILFCIFPSVAFSQYVKEFRAYFDTNRYYIVDSIKLKIEGDVLYIAYDNEDESTLLLKRGNSYFAYTGFLPCYLCQGRGTNSPTYIGHKNDNYLILVHEYLTGRDSVYLDFSRRIPLIHKIVRRSYQSEDIPGPDYSGNYLFIAKKNATINLFNLPINNTDPFAKKYFYIKKIKWKPIFHQ